MTSTDLLLMLLVLLATLALGLAGAKSEGDSEDFLLAGRSLPWWAAGTSMVATTFAVDTPLVVAGITARGGLSANWFWWGLLGSHVLVTFALAGRWRATGCTTDAEVVRRRYGDGPAARRLRQLRAWYFMGPINLFVLGWVLHAGAKVLGTLIPFDHWISPTNLAAFASGGLDGPAVLGLLCSLMIALAYGTVAGLRGVVWTDLLQFSLAMSGALALAYFCYQAVGGASGLGLLLEQGQAGLPPADLQLLAALNPMDPGWLLMSPPPRQLLDAVGAHGDTALAALLLSWWANKNADGGGVLVQRMLASRSPKDATWAMGWFTAAHYLLRPWAWLIVGLVVATMSALPPSSGFEQSYPDAMLSLLPSGVLGLALGGMIAALVSTADTHLHWGASYIASDLLPERTSDTTRLKWSRWVQPPMALLAAVIALHLDSIAGAWKILLVLGAGLGPPTLLRWFLWRIDARAELWAFATSTVAAALVLFGPWPRPGFAAQLAIVGSVGLAATLISAWRQPCDQAIAARFDAETAVVPKSWWRTALLAIAFLLTAAYGGRLALTGSTIGWILALGSLLAYAAVLRRFGHRLAAPLPRS